MSILALTFAASSGHISPLVPVIVVVMGVILFLVGFLKYREYRVLADTPQIPIRSVSMGLSHVAGTSTGGQPLTSPLTQVPCYYYEVKVEKKVKKDNQGYMGRNCTRRGRKFPSTSRTKPERFW